jgi:hypothetical protein
MLSILRSSSIDRPPTTSTMARKLLHQTMMNHYPSVSHQWQRSLSVLPSMNLLPRKVNDTLASSLPIIGQEGIRRLYSTASQNHTPAATVGVGVGWNQQPIRHFSSKPPPPPGGGNLGNIFQHAQNANNNKNSKPGQTLEQYGVDLTQLAKEGKLDPVIGRHEEIRRTLQILARRTKNNPVLIGEPGVGEC